jgi:hypothetical protein
MLGTAADELLDELLELDEVLELDEPFFELDELGRGDPTELVYLIGSSMTSQKFSSESSESEYSVKGILAK